MNVSASISAQKLGRQQQCSRNSILPSLKLKPARARLKHMFLRSVVCAVLAWNQQLACFSQMPVSRITLPSTVVQRGKSPPVPSQPSVPVRLRATAKAVSQMTTAAHTNARTHARTHEHMLAPCIKHRHCEHRANAQHMQASACSLTLLAQLIRATPRRHGRAARPRKVVVFDRGVAMVAR